MQLKDDSARFFRYTRMSPALFHELLVLVRPSLVKRSNREPICPEQRLLVTLRFLGTGDSFSSIASAYFMGESTVGIIVEETCKALVAALVSSYFQCPATEAEWLAIAEGFEDRWNMPHALARRHESPANSGSLYHNYKGTFSTVLLAVADHRYKITYAHWNNYGHNGDAGIFDRSDFKAAILNGRNSLNLPSPAPLPDYRQDTLLPYFFLGDQAFPLMENLMKPYPATVAERELKVFNYRLSRARRIVKSTFVLLCARWRILLRPMEMSVTRAFHVLHAIMCLHNYLVEESDEPFAALGASEDSIRIECSLQQAAMRRPNAHRYPAEAEEVRDLLVGYFSGLGAVAWQNQQVFVLPENQQA